MEKTNKNMIIMNMKGRNAPTEENKFSSTTDHLTSVIPHPKGPQPEWPAGELDIRVSALSRASQRLLARLEAWERIAELGVCPYREMHVWDSGGSGSIHFDCAEIGESDLGQSEMKYIVHR